MVVALKAIGIRLGAPRFEPMPTASGGNTGDSFSHCMPAHLLTPDQWRKIFDRVGMGGG